MSEGYLRESRLAVLQALFLCNKPSTVTEVKEMGRERNIEVPESNRGRSPHCVWDFGDRVGRALRAGIRSGYVQINHFPPTKFSIYNLTQKGKEKAFATYVGDKNMEER